MQKISIEDMQANAAEAETLLSLLANKHRLMILCELIDGPRTVTTLLERSVLSQSALSQHLAKLRGANLVSTERQGQSIRYSIASPKARKLIETLCDMYRD